MENNQPQRLHWLDASRGVALSITMFLHLLRWVLSSFHGWDFTQSSLINWEVATVRFLEGYLRISWVAPFAFAFVISLRPYNYTFDWLIKRFALLIILPTAVYGFFGYLDVGHFVLRWEIIQSLFFYNLIALFMIDLKAVYRYGIYILMLISTVYLHIHQAEFADRSLFWNLMVGDLKQNNFFSIMSGLPAFFFFYELGILSYNKLTHKLNFKPLMIGFILSSLAVAFLWISKINQIEPTHYPPQLTEYFFAFATSCLVLMTTFKLKDSIGPRNFLAILGRYCWVHFIGHLAIGALLFDVLGFGKNTLTFPQGVLFASGVLLFLWLANVWVLNLREKRGFDVDRK